MEIGRETRFLFTYILMKSQCIWQQDLLRLTIRYS